jgi:hypothetical protein
MKRIILFACVSLFGGMLHAQVPKYMYTSWDGPAKTNTAFFHVKNNKVQSLYYPGDFPNMPAGFITSVYLRVSSAGLDDVDYHNVRLKLGNTSDSAYQANDGYYTFKTGLTQVSFTSMYHFTGMKTEGKWIKFPVVGNVYYDRLKNIVVEISHGPEIGNNFGGFDWMASNRTLPNIRAVGGEPDSLRSRTGSTAFMDLGFDMSSSKVADLNGIRSFGLFPNPSTDGRFVVSAESSTAISQATVTVSNSMGQIIFNEEYKMVGKSLFKEIHLKSARPGAYFVETVIDGEHVNRQLTLL